MEFACAEVLARPIEDTEAECRRVREKLMSDGPREAAAEHSGVECDARRVLRQKLLRDSSGVALDQHVPEPQGPIEYRVLLHDGTPVFPRPGEDPAVPLPSSHAAGVEVVYRIASWEESELNGAWGRTARHPTRPRGSR